MKIIDEAMGCIPAGIKLSAFPKGSSNGVSALGSELYQDLFKGLARFSFPLLEWFPLCWRFPQAMDLGADPLWPDVIYQGSLGSCVDNAVSTCLSWAAAKETGKNLQLSRLFLYYNARMGVPEDIGSTIGNCAFWASIYGAPEESLWPYDVTKFALRPPQAAWDAARSHRLCKSFFTLTLGQMLHSINSGYPIAFGFDMYSSFGSMNASQGWVCPMPTSADTFLGGHCVTIRGYDLKKKLFLCQNSWGLWWGNHGLFWMPFDYVCSPLLASGWRTFRKIAD